MNFVKKYPLLVAFLLPLFICVIICIGNGIYPFGENCLLHMDLYHQYLPFFTELHEKLRSGRSLMYTWHIGLGSDFVSVFAYYLASPLNWLVVLFPKDHIIEFIEILILFKIAISGSTFFYFLKEHFGLVGKDGKYHERTFLPAFVFSTAYALSGFVAAYSWDVMWMDVVALAPLAIIGLEKLVRDGKPFIYYVSLAIAILSNYYLSIMLCIFLVFYFAWLVFTQKGGKIAAIIRFAVYSLLAGGTAAVLIIPELIILSYSGSSGIEFPKVIEWYFNLLSEVGRMSTAASVYEGAENWPNLYAGVFSVLLVILFVMNSRISWKRKIAPVAIVLFFAVSFSNKQLDFIWHGLHFPDSLPGRQSYLFAFLVLTIGYATIRKWRGIKIWHTAVALVFTTALMAVSTLFTPEDITDYYAIVIGMLFVIAYAILIVLIKLVGKKNKQLLMCIVCGLAVVELAVNMAVTGLGCTSRVSYNANVDDIEQALKLAKEDADELGEPFYRVEDTGRLTKNDDTRYGYASGTQFSSLMNINVSHFYQALYMEGGKNFYCYNGATPITSAMLSVRYQITQTEKEGNPLTTLVGRCGSRYLYRNNYTLPLGYMVDQSVVDSWKPERSSKLYSINSLGKLLGADSDTLTSVDCIQNVQAGQTTITFENDGYFYAAYESCGADSLTFTHGQTKTTYSKTTHRYMFDLGYFKAGETLTVTNSSADPVRFTVYELDMNVVQTAYDTLSKQTLEVDEFSDTHIRGHIDVNEAGRLVLSIPSESGWTMKVDGKAVDYEDFCDTFISVDLESGEHEIELSYETPRLKTGAMISGGCVGIFIILMLIRRYRGKHRTIH